jgi:hypothetical protein
MNQFFDTTSIFNGQGLTAICHSSEDQFASTHGHQKTKQMDDKLFTVWAFHTLPRKKLLCNFVNLLHCKSFYSSICNCTDCLCVCMSKIKHWWSWARYHKHNELNARQNMFSNSCFVAYLHQLSPITLSMWWSSPSSEELHIADCPCPLKMCVVCIVIFGYLLPGTEQEINWSSLETRLRSFLRWANVQTENKTLTQNLTKEHYPSHMKHVGWFS